MSFQRILIIDNTYDNLHLLTRILRSEGYEEIETVMDSSKALEVIVAFQPDLIILDLMMDVVDGYNILRDLGSVLCDGEFLPVLVVTADCSNKTRERALSLGATDFITRPHQLFDVVLRVRNLLRARNLYLRSQQGKECLESLVQERTKHLEEVNGHLVESRAELQRAKRDVLERLVLLGEYRDDDTGKHTKRVAKTSYLLTVGLMLPDEMAYYIQLAAPLHDLGKVGIPDSILLKPGRLTPGEFSRMKTHTIIGAQLLDNGKSELLQMAHAIALTHHERWDGTGYPRGLKGEEIPIEGRIVAIADVFDALTHARPYKSAWSIAEAVAEIEKQSERQFDPQLVQVFLTLDHEALI